MGEEVQIDELSIAVEKSATDASKSLRSLANALGKMRSELSRLNITNGQIKQIQKLTDALKPLQSLPKSNLSGYVNSLKKIPDVIAGLEKVDFDNFRLQIARVTDTMRPLADEMQKVANGFSAMPTKIQRFITQSEKMNSSTKRNTSTHKTFFDTLINGSSKASSALKNLATAGIAGLSLKKIVGGIEDSTENLMNYIENLNLFYVSMGEYGEKAYKYAREISGTMGIDVSEWTRYQAVIMDMSKSFGVTSDTAYTMSKALTQLTYDFSSLYNLKIDEAATKVQSAIAGEIEPIRRLGKDLSVAKLQLTATELGINSNVEAMTQAEKAMLRTITLLRQSSSAQGDLARTLDQPANQMRILKAQLNELARALGEVFLPLLQKGLPYVIATVKVLRLVIHEFAVLAGFKLPEFEFTTTEESVNGVNDALDGTIEKVEKLNQLSFDQLNILGTPNSSTGTGSSADIAKLTEELNRLAKIEDEAFSKEITSRADEITAAITEWLTKGKGISVWAKDIWDKMIGVKDAVVSIGDSLGIWDIPEKIWNILKSMSLDVSKVGINFAGSALDGVVGDDNLRDVLGNALGIALLAGAGLKLLSGGAAGVISYGLGIGIGILGLKMLFDNTKLDDVDSSEKNKLYQSVKTALSLGLMGASLSLIGGKGFKHSLNLGLSIATLTLFADAITTPAHNTSEGLINAAKIGISGMLGGFAISLQGGLKGLKATGMPLSLGLSGLSLSALGINYLGDEDTANDLAGALSLGIGSILTIAAGAISGAKIASMLGMSAAGGALFAAGITVTVGVTILATFFYDESRKALETVSSALGKDIRNKSDQYADLLTSDAKDILNMANMNPTQSKIDKIISDYDPNYEYSENKLPSSSGNEDYFNKVYKKKLVPAYASGGIVEDGMFYANSGELVGRFSNGRTAVANNAIITEGIERAVYRAMMSSRRSNGGKTYLVLDGQVVGKVFGDAIDNERRRSGVEIQVGGGR